MKNQEDFVKSAEALVEKMTVEEAASQLLHSAPAIERLGVPAYNWWSEALHGVARAGIATVFPQAIGMAAAFDPAFLKKEAEVIATEGRAKYNAAVAEGDRDIYKGLTFWSPNINIFRDPRWGRGHETYGEDPLLTEECGKAFVEGLQGDGDYLKTAACAKHFAVHSGPESLRHEFNAEASPKDLRETYLPAFEALVKEAHVEAVMGAYNRTNGEPCCGSQTLLVDILRKEWGFTGHVVSDCWAVRDFHEHHHVTENGAQSASLAVRMGCDLNCGCTYEHLLEGLEQGLITEEEIRRSAVHVFTTRFKLGMFDPACEYNEIPYSEVHKKKHVRVALKAAEKSIVLLKNDGILPLCKEKLKTIGVIGPNAYSIPALYGNYNGDSDEWVTNLDGIRKLAGEKIRVRYSKGCSIFCGPKEKLSRRDRFYSEAVAVAKESELVILCVGLDGTLEGEQGDTGNSDAAGDKTTLLLPECQRILIQKVLGVGKPVILVINSGSSLDLSMYEKQVSAIVQCWYSGERGGEALARVIFGKANPCGKLPVTFYYEENQLPEFTDYSMQGRTYRYFAQKPWYPFGYGLSYTDFAYEEPELTFVNGDGSRQQVLFHPTVREIRLSVTVKNTGKMAGTEIVESYLRYEGEAFEKPNHKLVTFQTVSLKPGEKKRVTLRIPAKRVYSVDQDGKQVLYPGEYTLFAGGSQPDERSRELLRTEPLKVSFYCGV
ncbi:MAG: glycoside hydrolase family 3 C-terminal domain-containing protein [Lachnospiraceae bacterium]|nr:glycoside hydrolase family 3 C-terminal domain-containing protein [Lachnospiraceae bacterium]